MLPVKPRALIFDLLGDYVRYGTGEIRLKSLVTLSEQMGVAPSTMRVMVTRLRDEGWLDVRREGRESIYSPTSKCLHMLDEGRQRIFRGEPPAWSGSWSMVIYTVPESDRPTREQLRRDLSWLGFGPLAPATWVSPHRLLESVANVGAGLPNARLDLLTMKAADIGADRAIAARCWDLGTLNAEYAAFIRDVRVELADYPLLDGASAMASRIRLVQSFRRFPFRDPGVPAELQPAGWLGEQARTLFDQAYEMLAAGARAHYQDVVGDAENPG
ncbi:MAG TPA: PaaX family transcriptional regulator C-terminal domain-containing protein [Trebonia sp.]